MWALSQFQKRWPAWDIWRGSANMHLRGGPNTRDMFIRAVRRSGRWFPERGCILEHQIFRFAEMISRDRCSTSYDLGSLSRGRRSTLESWDGKSQKRIGTRLSAQHSAFQFWRKSRKLLCFWCCQLWELRKSLRTALFLTLSSSKTEEVSQKGFVLDVVNFENCGSLAE